MIWDRIVSAGCGMGVLGFGALHWTAFDGTIGDACIVY